MQILKWLAVCSVFLLPDITILAEPAIALGYKPKYPTNFKHFDYVNPDAPKGGELILNGNGNFDSFNNFALKGVKAEGLGELVFESLMVQSADEPYSLYAHIAEDVKLAKDKMSIIFRLDSRAKFSDGSKVKPEDVKFTFETIKEKGHPFYKFFWADITKAIVISQNEIKFNFSKKYPELPLIASQIPVFAKKWIGDKEFGKVSRELPIATGPYVIEKYRLGKDITYKRNPDYWAKNKNTTRGMYNFDRVTYKYYKDETVRLEALKAGEFHFLHENYSKLWAREHTGPKYDSGEIKKVKFQHKNNAGMQGFYFNTRKNIFKDIRLRKAISLAYDFTWANKNLFYNQYVRCDSYFSNSDIATRALPQGLELSLLKKYKKQFPNSVPDEVFTKVWQPSRITDQKSLREHLRKAKKLLDEAGWKVKDGVLQNEKGEKLEFEVLLAGKGFERIMGAFAHNLKRKLGIQINYRTVDVSLWVRRVRKYDFDMIVSGLSQSQLPGKELVNYWHSSVINEEGARNYAGVNNPVVDDLLEKIVNTTDRNSRVAMAKAIDRILLFGEYLVPNWYIAYHRVAYWDRFNVPKKIPLYYSPTPWALQTWWMKEKKGND